TPLRSTVPYWQGHQSISNGNQYKSHSYYCSKTPLRQNHYHSEISPHRNNCHSVTSPHRNHRHFNILPNCQPETSNQNVNRNYQDTGSHS
ncbi:29865_t:CDS:1, partial [Racocetra persica]